jgi:hypothetical protein
MYWEFSVAHKGKGVIEDHVKTAKHRSAINVTASANIKMGITITVIWGVLLKKLHFHTTLLDTNSVSKHRTAHLN